MEIHNYLVQKERRLARGSKRIKDYRVFDFNFIPDKPLMRQEVKPIADALLRYAKTGVPNNLLVIGSRGSGKTLLVRYLMKLLTERENMCFEYVNCRNHNTSFKILAHLLDLRPRGTSLDELWQRFEQTRLGAIVIILDEIDLMSEKDRNKDILYLLSRSSKNYMVILLSNNPRFQGFLDESVRSTLQPEVIHFRNYTAPQLRKILEDRARMGLKRIPATLLFKISALTVRNTNSDVRVAIKTLYFMALEPEAGLNANFERARRDILLDVINDLNDKNLMILKASQLGGERYVKSVYELYKRISADCKEEPYSYVYFYNNLSYLQSLGLIILISTKVRRTYTNRIQLLFEPELLNTVWRARFG